MEMTAVVSGADLYVSPVGSARAGAGAAGAAAGVFGNSAATQPISSAGSAMTPMSWPTGTCPPSGTMIFRSTPPPNASISTLALSVSI